LFERRQSFLWISFLLPEICQGLCFYSRIFYSLDEKEYSVLWTDKTQKSFDKFKAAFLATDTLAYPHPNLPCLLDTETSDVAVGAGVFVSQLAVVYPALDCKSSPAIMGQTSLHQEAVCSARIRFVIAKPLLSGKLSSFVFCCVINI